MNVEEQMRIAANIKYLRQVLGYTQSSIADKLHMSRSSYCLVESGKRAVSIEILLDLSRLYNLKTDTILQLNEKLFQEFVNSNDLNEKQCWYLNQLYNQMSTFAKGRLIERAEILLSDDVSI